MPAQGVEVFIICIASCFAQCVVSCIGLMTAGSACNPDQKTCNGTIQGISSFINCIICIVAIYFMFFRK